MLRFVVARGSCVDCCDHMGVEGEGREGGCGVGVGGEGCDVKVEFRNLLVGGC